MASGRDQRDAMYGGVHVRVLTLPGPGTAGEDGQGGPTWVQAGFELTLHEQQEAQLLWTIGVLSLVGLAGAALVTWLVTRRALVPVRAAFATERRFVAAASHELRTPVAIVRASAEILDREGLVAADGQPFVTDIVSETDRMGRLVGDMLALASAEAGAVTVSRHPVELVGFLTDLARRADSMAGAHGLVIRTDLPAASSVVVEADEDRLTQVLLILVDNAIEHSPSAGTITLGLAVQGGRVVISVSDQGPGVPVADRERIFEPFARLPGDQAERDRLRTGARHRPPAGGSPRRRAGCRGCPGWRCPVRPPAGVSADGRDRTERHGGRRGTNDRRPAIGDQDA